MNRNQKKSLYESIMKSVSKTVKHKLNESETNGRFTRYYDYNKGDWKYKKDKYGRDYIIVWFPQMKCYVKIVEVTPPNWEEDYVYIIFNKNNQYLGFINQWTPFGETPENLSEGLIDCVDPSIKEKYEYVEC